MPDPGYTRPYLSSIRAAAGQAELAGAVGGGLGADGHPPAGDDPPAPLTSGIDRAIRLSTAVAVLAVAGIAAYVSYGHAYAVVRAHGETGITARLEPATIDGLVWASSMVVLYAARHRVPVPSLARWLLALGIAATLTANMAQGWSHGPVGAVVAAWPTVSLVGSYKLLVWLIRTSGAADRGPSPAHLRTGAACRAARRPVPASAVDRERPGGSERGTSGPAWRPAGQAAGQSPISASGQREMRRLRPALAMTQRWPRTGSACRPATRCRNAGSPRCSDAHPAAGHEPESPMHSKHRRSQTRRVPRSRLTRKQGPSAVSPERDLTAPGIPGIGAWRSATSALCVNLDAMRAKGLAWLGIPAGDYAAGPVLRRDPGPGSCLRCREHRGTYRRERRQDPATRPRPPLLRVLPKPRRQHRPATRGGRPGSGAAALARGGAELLGEPESDGTWTWLTFRAPDGNIHSLGARMA